MTLWPPADSPNKGDVIWIAIELVDIVPDPLECQLLVLQTEVGISQRDMGQEAQRTQAVIEGHHYHALLYQPHWFVTGTAGAINEGAAVDPDHDRILPGLFRRIDIQEQAILIQTCFTEGAGILRTTAAEGFTQLDGISVSRRESGRGKALGYTVAKATEYPHAVMLDPDVITLLGGDLQWVLNGAAVMTAAATASRQAATQAGSHDHCR